VWIGSNKIRKTNGFCTQEPKPYQFTSRTDYFGWQPDDKGLWHYTFFGGNGRVTDDENVKLKSALLEASKTARRILDLTC